MRCILRFLEELMAPLVVDIFFFFFLPLLHGHSGILVPFAIYGTFETLFFSSSPPFSIYFRLFGGVYVWRIKMIREFNRSLSNRDS